MKSEDERMFLEWSRTKEHKKRVRDAKKKANEKLKLYNKPYIAFSGGKDSIAMTHILLQKENMKIYHCCGGLNIPKHVKREIRCILDFLGAKDVDWVDGNGWSWIYRNYVGVYDCCFLGLRKEEGVKRRQRILQNNWLTDIAEVWILEDWSYKDVWAYLLSNRIPYPSTYDIYSQCVDLKTLRFHSFFEKENDIFGNSNLDKFFLWRYAND